MGQLGKYYTFKELGQDYTAPVGYTKIRVHLVYDVMHNGRHKSRLVAYGNRNDNPVKKIYSVVVYLCGILLLIFIAQLNKMETLDTDIGNTYLDKKSLKKVYIVSGTKFGNREGRVLIFSNALYGL